MNCPSCGSANVDRVELDGEISLTFRGEEVVKVMRNPCGVCRDCPGGCENEIKTSVYRECNDCSTAFGA